MTESNKYLWLTFPTLPFFLLAFFVIIGARTEEHSGWEDLRFPVTAVRIGPTFPPTYAQFRNDGAGSVGVFAYQFADQAVNEEQYYLTAQIPHRWEMGSDINFHAHVTPEDNTACNYRTCIEYSISPPDGAWTANTTIVCETFASIANASIHQFIELAEISTAGQATSSVLHARFYRNSSVVADTCNGKFLWVHSSDFHFQHDTIGSSLELSK